MKGRKVTGEMSFAGLFVLQEWVPGSDFLDL